MEQNIPDINNEDIRRIIQRDFPEVSFGIIENALKMYASESEKGRNRIYASILKLAHGEIELLKEYVKKANDDYRDIIALSEYPNYSKFDFDVISDETKKQLIEQDWTQYNAWFNKESLK